MEVLMPDEGARSATRPTVSAEWAGRMIDAAVTRAQSMSISVTVVVVDESGVLKGMLRMDDAPLVSVQTAISKAYAAAAIGMPPDDFYSAIEADGAAVASFATRSFATRPGLALIAGGLPVIVGGPVAGGVGIAGAMTGADDRAIAEAAVAAVFG
jgi:uncharacterized protein GlcG (DUF336 family)